MEWVYDGVTSLRKLPNDALKEGVGPGTLVCPLVLNDVAPVTDTAKLVEDVAEALGVVLGVTLKAHEALSAFTLNFLGDGFKCPRRGLNPTPHWRRSEAKVCGTSLELFQLVKSVTLEDDGAKRRRLQPQVFPR